MDCQGVHENRSGARAAGRWPRRWQIGRGALRQIIWGVASCCVWGLPAQFWRLCGSGQVLGRLSAPLVVATARSNPPGIGSLDRLPREALPPPSEGLLATLSSMSVERCVPLPAHPHQPSVGIAGRAQRTSCIGRAPQFGRNRGCLVVLCYTVLLLCCLTLAPMVCAVGAAGGPLCLLDHGSTYNTSRTHAIASFLGAQLAGISTTTVRCGSASQLMIGSWPCYGSAIWATTLRRPRLLGRK